MKDVLLHLDSYPEPTPKSAIDQAVGFVSLSDARISALAVQVLIRPPNNPLANALIGLAAMAAEEQAKSSRACKDTTAYFEGQAKARDVFESTIVTQGEMPLVGDCIAAHAKTRDVCIVPVANENDGQRGVAETVIFASGRPTLLFRPGPANLPQKSISTVVLAWDNSRTAARAMADALPLLRRAAKVRVLTVTNEKTTATAGVGIDAVRHLKLHGVNAEIDEVDGSGKSIGATLDAYLDTNACDLLVMGAYGKSRVREFILGGATAHVLARMRVPLFLVH
jgi:nucleotide-binding universal stress UspA family protein